MTNFLAKFIVEIPIDIEMISLIRAKNVKWLYKIDSQFAIAVRSKNLETLRYRAEILLVKCGYGLN